MKKECSIVKDLLPLYQDNVVAKDTKAFVENHLKTCTECQKYLEDLQFKVEKNDVSEVGAFQKFAKKIHFKLFRNTFLGIFYFAILSFCVFYFAVNFPLKLKYNPEMEVGFYEHEGKNDYFLQIASPIPGQASGMEMEKNGITYLFVTWKSTLFEHFEDIKKSKMVDVPDVFSHVELNDKVRVYYTKENFEKIEKANDKEWKKILEKSHLMFNEETKKTKIDCTLNNENYSYTLEYYKLNNQIVDGEGGEEFPMEVQIKRSSIMYGESTSMWYKGGKASTIFKRTEEYMTSKGGTCTKIDLEE